MATQLEYLRNKTNLSEYDVKYAQQQLEILQKQIALEEAQNNKSQMRLQRNAAGNYDFVYAADEDAVNDAQSALLEAQQSAYNLSKNAYLDTYQSALEAAQKAKTMIIEVATDASLSTAEQAERIQYILDNLKEYLDGSSEELGEIATNLYNDVANTENLIAEENLGNLANTFQAMEDKSYNILDSIDDRFALMVNNTLVGVEQINDSVADAFDDLKDYIEEYGEKTKDVLEECGDSYDTFVTDSLDYANERTIELQSNFAEFTTQISEFTQIITKSAEAIHSWGEQISKSMEQAKDYIDYANNLEAQEAAKQAAAAQAATASSNIAIYETPTYYSSDGGGGGDDDWSPYDDAYGIWVYGD